MFGISLRKRKLLLDECVSRRVIVTSDSKAIAQSIEVSGLGYGAKDSQIRQIAKSTGQTIVSQDYNMLCQCLDNGINTALYYKGRAYVVKLQEVQEIGTHCPIVGFVAP